MTETIIIGIFLVFTSYYAGFLATVLKGIRRVKASESQADTDDFVSIIIPFRNESKNILRSLRSLRDQQYPPEKFEVIYVNDSSEDDSLEIITNADKPPNIKIINSDRGETPNSHKKRAIEKAILSCKGSIIVLSDADCVHNPAWLKNLLSCFDKNTGFVSGPVAFSENDQLFKRFQYYEFAGLILTGAGLIDAGRPIICNGANIAFKRTAFEEVGGYRDNLKISSGDDGFLMQKIKNETAFKIKFCWKKDAVVVTEPSENLLEFYQQRKRWASKNVYYSDKRIVINLVLIYLFYLQLFLMPLFSYFISPILLIAFIIGISVKVSLEYKILKMGTTLFSERIRIKFFLLAQLFHIPYILLMGASGLFGSYNWKLRKIKR